MNRNNPVFLEESAVVKHAEEIGTQYDGKENELLAIVKEIIEQSGWRHWRTK